MHIAFLPGDDIGPEISAATRKMLDTLDERLGLGLRIEEHPMGLATLASYGSALPDDVLEETRRADGVILGPVSTYDYPPAEQGGINPSATIRIALDLYANIRPSRTRAGVDSVAKEMDLVVVLSDEAAALSGGLGLACALNAGDDHAIAQAVHGSAPDIAGRGIANPSALMLSVSMLLDWLGTRHGRTELNKGAVLLAEAVNDALADSANHTPDLGGNASTESFTEAVAGAIAKLS